MPRTPTDVPTSDTGTSATETRPSRGHPTPSRFRAVVFDCDGVLVDSAAAWTQAFVQAAATLGHTLTGAQRDALLGASVDSGASRIAAWAGRPDQAAVLRSSIAAALRAATETRPPRPLPGVAALLTALNQRVPMAVASNAPRDVLDATLRASGLDAAFDAVLSADQVGQPKPAPDVYLAACTALARAPDQAVAVEDSRDGATAAQVAGLALLVVTTGTWPTGTPVDWPARHRPILYATALSDPTVPAYLLGPSADPAQ